MSFSKQIAALSQTFASHPASAYLPAFNQIAQARGSRLFVVGGCLRDALMGRDFHDVDLLLCGNLASFLESVSTSLRLKVFPLDESRGQYRIAVKREPDLFFDISPCAAGQIESSLLDRDFSINAMALDLNELLSGKGHILDPQGGLDDLSKKVVRTASAEILRSDPARVLRAFRFAASFHFSIESKTEAFIRETAHLVRHVSMERVRDELFRILLTAESYFWLRQLDDLAILELFFPEATSMKETEQDRRFHIHDVWNHSLETVRSLEKILISTEYPEGDLPMAGDRTRKSWLKFVALFHDVGKPSTQSKDESGLLHFHGHAEAGASLITGIGERLRLSTKEIKGAALLVTCHLRPTQLARSGSPSEAAIRRLFRDASPYARELLLLSLADTMAKGKQASALSFVQKLLQIA